MTVLPLIQADGAPRARRSQDSRARLLAAARTTLGELLADQAQLQADLDEEAVAVGGGDR